MDEGVEKDTYSSYADRRADERWAHVGRTTAQDTIQCAASSRFLALFLATGASPSARPSRLRTSTSRSIRRRRTSLPGATSMQVETVPVIRGEGALVMVQRLSGTHHAPRESPRQSSSEARRSATSSWCSSPQIAGTLIVLSVRDWRLLRVHFLWPPVADAAENGQRRRLAQPVRSPGLAVPGRGCESPALRSGSAWRRRSWGTPHDLARARTAVAQQLCQVYAPRRGRAGRLVGRHQLPRPSAAQFAGRLR